MISIKNTLEMSLKLIDGIGEGKPFSRYKSWEYCHDIFKKMHVKSLTEELNDNDYDLLALNLSFYLASWGMYRGSTFLLQRDYKTHVEIVKVICDKKYNTLWDFDPSANMSDSQYSEKINLIDNAFSTILSKYRPIKEKDYGKTIKDNTELVTVTLITKILLGTFAVSPAFDRYFISGIKYWNNFDLFGKTGSYENIKQFKKCINKVFEFYKKHKSDLVIQGHNDYPPMKIVDMYFWELGYQYDFLDVLEKKKKSLIEAKKPLTENGKRPYQKLRLELTRHFPDSLNFEQDLSSIEALENTKEKILVYLDPPHNT